MFQWCSDVIFLGKFDKAPKRRYTYVSRCRNVHGISRWMHGEINEQPVACTYPLAPESTCHGSGADNTMDEGKFVDERKEKTWKLSKPRHRSGRAGTGSACVRARLGWN